MVDTRDTAETAKILQDSFETYQILLHQTYKFFKN